VGGQMDFDFLYPRIPPQEERPALGLKEKGSDFKKPITWREISRDAKPYNKIFPWFN